MKHEALIKRLEVSCLGLDAVDPLRLLVNDVVAALREPEQEPVAWFTQARNFVPVNEFTEEEAKLYGWNALYLHPPQPEQEPVALREALAASLTSVYVCGRVWSAWNVGTMTEDDFQPAADCDELLDSLIEAVAIATPPAQPPQRTWVGLTKEKLMQFAEAQYGWDDLIVAVEAKLKEKNT